VLLKYPGVNGLVIRNTETTLPVRKGLSSSAACCVLVARAFNVVYSLKLSVRDEMELAYLGERTTPSQCGRMDQGCAFGSVPVLMVFDGEALHTEPVSVGGDFHFVVVDLCAQKNTVVILEQLNNCFPVARDDIAKGVQVTNTSGWRRGRVRGVSTHTPHLRSYLVRRIARS
jgi:galactokinase